MKIFARICYRGFPVSLYSLEALRVYKQIGSVKRCRLKENPYWIAASRIRMSHDWNQIRWIPEQLCWSVMLISPSRDTRSYHKEALDADLWQEYELYLVWRIWHYLILDCSYIHRSVYRNYILSVQPTKCNASQFLFISARCSTRFRLYLRPSSGAPNCTWSFRYLSSHNCYLLRQIPEALYTV